MKTLIQVGECFAHGKTLSIADISLFAELIGDSNPVHHDAIEAKRVGLAGIIASGPHTSAILTALLADHYSHHAPMLGLEFAVKFLHPILADRPCRFEWEVVDVQAKSSLFGELISLSGRVVQDSRTAVSATAVVAVMFDKVTSDIQKGDQ